MSRWTADGAVIELVARQWGWRAPGGETIELIGIGLAAENAGAPVGDHGELEPDGRGRWFAPRFPNGITASTRRRNQRFGWTRELAEAAGALGVEQEDLTVVTRHWLVVAGEDGGIVSRTYLGESVDEDGLAAGLAGVGAVPA